MRTFDQIVENLSIALKYIAAILMFGLALMILTDVIARGIFNRPILGLAELVASCVVIIAFLQLSYSVRFNSMLRAEVIDGLVGDRLRALLAIFGLLCGAVFFALIVYGAWTPMMRAWATGEYAAEGGLRIPTFPVRASIVFCGALAAVNYVLLAIREGMALTGVSQEN